MCSIYVFQSDSMGMSVLRESSFLLYRIEQVQDHHEPETYNGVYETYDEATKIRALRTGKYADLMIAEPLTASILSDGASVLFDRQVLYGLPPFPPFFVAYL